MSRRDVVASSLTAATIAPLVILAELALHELTHVAINALATWQVASCGLGPFTLRGLRPAVCLVPGGIPAWNALATPVLMSGVGIALMHYSTRLESRGRRWGVFWGGLVIWLEEALYSAGYYTPPSIEKTGVEYFGDGIRALEAFGWPAQIPAAVLLAVGIVVVSKRVEYTRPTRRRDGRSR